VNDSAEALHVQIDRLLEVGRPADAISLVGRLLQLQPGDPEALFLAARLEHAEGRLGPARAQLSEVIVRAPQHTGARLLLFTMDLDAGHFAEAETTILDLLRMAPANPELLALYARLMLRVYQLDKARALVNEALRQAPEHPLAQVLDALLHIIHGDDAQASARLGRLMIEDPEAIHVAWTALAVLQAQNRPREVLEIGRQLLRATPDDGDLIDVVIEARLQSHWSMKPLWPIVRFGWGGMIGLWVLAGLGLKLASGALGPSLAGSLGSLYVLYIAYSWIWPPIFRRRLQRRGF
jgi:tetratricopeptide (TPR) repeat protein